MKQLVKKICLASIVLMMLFNCSCKTVTDKTVTDKAEADKAVADKEVTGKAATDEVVADEHLDKTLDAWRNMSGCFTRNDSSQYSNGILKMKYLSNDCVMFEFELMDGSESEDWVQDLVLPFVLLVDEKGVGHYESDPEAERPLTIDFHLSEDGQQVTVSHTGEVSISPDGVYNFVEEEIMISEISAIVILDHLATAATSLNSNNGAYTIQYPEALVGGWFYPVEVTFDDTGMVLAKFLISVDLSAVYRVDDDIEPVLIWGSAQPMLDKEIYILNEEIEEMDEITEDTSEEEIIAELDEGLQPVVSVVIKDGVNLKTGTISQLIPVMPWELPYTITAQSSNPSVIKVNEDGKVTAMSVGEATIYGKLIVDDGEKEFTIEVSVD